MTLGDHQVPLSWIVSQKSALRSTLVAWANQNSGSMHLSGLTRMSTLLKEAFSVLGASVQTVPLSETTVLSSAGQWETVSTVPALHLQKHPHAKRQILLTGHFDTVFTEQDPFQSCQWLDDNRLNGPGVNDMKGGLLIMLMALQALEQSAFSGKLGWEVILNPDEEMGSHCSMPFIISRAKAHTHALVFEPAMDETGRMASARKGSANYTIIAHGQAAHAGRSFEKGHNAIIGLAQVLPTIHTLSHKRTDLTVNVGRIRGGEAINIVPDKAVAWINVRVADNQDAEWVEGSIQSILNCYEENHDIQFELAGGLSRPAKVFSDKQKIFFNALKQTANTLDISLDWVASGGCCDGNNLAAQGLCVIDSLGGCGGQIHTSEEYILFDSIIERAQLTALFLMKIAQGECTL